MLKPSLNMAKNTDSILSRKEVLRISKDVGKTPAQVVLRWGLQRHTAVIPKTVQISYSFYSEAESFKFIRIC